jgi:hypothetical protein
MSKCSGTLPAGFRSCVRGVASSTPSCPGGRVATEPLRHFCYWLGIYWRPHKDEHRREMLCYCLRSMATL